MINKFWRFFMPHTVVLDNIKHNTAKKKDKLTKKTDTTLVSCIHYIRKSFH